MRKYLIFFLTFFFFLSLAASCQKNGSLEPQKSQVPGESSQDDSIETEASAYETADDCDSPPGGLEDMDPEDLPPGFTLDPEEPDKYLYVKEWHG